MSFFDRVTGNKTSEEELPKEEAKLVDAKFSIKSFFKITFAKIGVLCKLNLIMLLLVSPLVFTLFGMAGSFFGIQIADTAMTPVSPLYGQFAGIGAYEDNAVVDVISSPHMLLSSVNIDNTATIILKCIGLLVVFTFGPLNVGCAYVMRNTIKEQPVFVWHDFFGAIKKNLKQAIIFGVIDVVFLIAIPYALLFYYANALEFTKKMLFVTMIIIALLYMVMRVYIYLMIVTFDLKLHKLFKNAFILSSAGIKRSLMMVFGVLLIVLINVYVYIFIQSLGTLLPCLISVSLIMFVCYYCAYPVIKKYMIDPFYDENGQPKEISEEQ